MSKINTNFDIPYYIFEEIVDYIEINSNGIYKTSKWENILMLLNTAVINKKLTYEQAEYIKKTFCRE